ncbi:MAG TPA: sigma factor [Polyangiaceae bacterium]
MATTTSDTTTTGIAKKLIEEGLAPCPLGAPPPAPRAGFPTTSWSVVRRTRLSPEEARRALAELCRAYRRPVYAYYRKLGEGPDRAEDLVQGLFEKLLADGAFSRVDQRGRFRHWLCACARHFLYNQRAHERRRRRRPESLEEFAAEHHLLLEPREALTHDRVFDRLFALAVVERALERQRDDYAAKGAPLRIAELRAILADEDPALAEDRPSHARRRSSGALRSQRARARERIQGDFRCWLRREVLDTGVPFAELDTEVRSLMDALDDGRP